MNARHVILLCLLLAGPSSAEAVRPDGQLVVATCQFPVSADVSANGEWIRRQLREADLANADVVHFCETALSGYAGVDHESLEGFDWQELRQQTDSVLQLARELKLWVLLGSMHRLSDGHKPHNCLYVIDPEGTIQDRYDKRFCTSGDLEHYSPGDHFVTFPINGVTCGLLICYDVRFPELYREYSKLGAHLIFQSFYNARQKEGAIHPVIMPLTARARAATNNLFLSLSNSSAPRSWPCYMITPDGLVSGKLVDDEPGVLVSQIDIHRDYYDASSTYRNDAIDGKLNSGATVDDPRSRDRNSY